MIGQKILKTYVDDNTFEGLFVTAPSPPAAGLTLRRVQSKTLRIMTEDVMAGASTDRTHRLGSGMHRRTSLLLTPDTSHTFGCPNPTTVSRKTQDDAEPVSEAIVSATRTSLTDLTVRRQMRYSRAQQALETTFRHCRVEPSPQDLQIRALRRVTALLSAQARDAQEHAAKVRACLAGREAVEPQNYRPMQRTRWMEERRGADRDKQSKAVDQSLTAIMKPQTNAEKPAADDRPPTRHQLRRRTNLTRFFERSQTRVQFPSRPLSSTYHSASCRRQTISHVRSIRLRSPSLSQTRVKPLNMLLKLRQPPGKSIISPSGAHSDLAGSPAHPIMKSFPSSVTLRTFPSVEDPPENFDQSLGVARIYTSSTTLRPRDEIIADMEKVVLPRYALDLLDELAATAAEVSLEPILASRATRVSLPSFTLSSDSIAHARSHSAAEGASRTSPRRYALGKGALLDVPIPRKSKYGPSPSVSSIPESFTLMSRPSADLTDLVGSDREVRARSPRAGTDAHRNGHNRFSIVSVKGTGGVMSKVKSRLAALGHR
ncbi:hypothetical protein SCP_1303560 [Sparassis crispa]|uniref:Uncharacterized protein n=1 Tax=Sparassis crispa TaxID=139825 RepID=A0A401H2F2_9APHY|nr:hypothetical protein SCP_1303560 [Sparassis crispa]GBE88540.1 hypothetical protein SCP_1303560 [Sparassis crispa]